VCLDQVWGENKKSQKEKEITKSKKENNNNNKKQQQQTERKRALKALVTISYAMDMKQFYEKKSFALRLAKNLAQLYQPNQKIH